jgi:hypothetical protein
MTMRLAHRSALRRYTRMRWGLPTSSKLREDRVRQICTEIAKRTCEPTGRDDEVATSSEFGRSRHPQPPRVASPDDARVTLADPVCPG